MVSPVLLMDACFLSLDFQIQQLLPSLEFLFDFEIILRNLGLLGTRRTGIVRTLGSDLILSPLLTASLAHEHLVDPLCRHRPVAFETVIDSLSNMDYRECGVAESVHVLQNHLHEAEIVVVFLLAQSTKQIACHEGQ